MKSYSSREVIGILKKDGWYEVACVGDHHQFKHSIKKHLQYINNFVDNEEHLQGNWEDREEKFSLSGPELVESMTEQIRDEVMEDMRIASVNKNKEIIQRLEEKGIFKVKESVAKVSEILGISKNTVYLHLRNLEVEK